MAINLSWKVTVMMQQESQRQKNGVYFFGEKSRLANWILCHPFHIAVGGVLLGMLICIGDKFMLTGWLMMASLLLGIALLLRLLSRKLCYWVEIDKISEKITFYRCFNKGIVEIPLRSVEFVFDIHFACHYAGERFTIFNEYMNGIAEILPPGMEIRFSNSFYGQFMKKQIERNRRRARKV